MEIKTFNMEDLDEEYHFLSTLQPENDFDNTFYGLTEEQFKDLALPRILSNAAGENLAEGQVPETIYFLWHKGEIIAMYRIKHKLTPEMINGIGHITFAVRPDQRKKHYGAKGLKMVAKEIKANKTVKDDDFYLRCDKNNKYAFKAMLDVNCYLHHSDDQYHYLRLRKSILD